MLEVFLVMFAAAVQSAGAEMAAEAAPEPSAIVAPAPQPGKSAKADTDKADNAAATSAEAAPAFLAPAGQAASGKSDNAAETAEAAPVFLAPSAGMGAGAGSGAEAAPVFLAPQKTAQAEAPPAFLAPSAPAASAAPALVAEPQVPTGKFTTATEVKPIMSATKGNWIAVRLYEGTDYLYVTQIWSWRCGLVQMRYGINGGPLQIWPLPACHEEYSTPNAVLEEDGLPAKTFPPNSISTVEIEITYDDLTTETAQFTRASVLMP